MKRKCANLKKDDKVKVITGNEKGKIGKVLRFVPESGRVVVEKINMVKRHTKPSGVSGQGGIIEKEAPLAISNVALICPKCMESTRIAHKFIDDGQKKKKKVRSCKKCNEQIDA